MGNSNKVFLSPRTFIALYVIAIILGISLATIINTDYMSPAFQIGILTFLVTSIGSYITIQKILPIIKKVITENNNN